MAPIKLQAKKIHNTLANPMTVGVASQLKSSAERMAPNFPTAAEMPCAKPLTLDGKTSAGMINVVALGPKLKKNFHIRQ
jgi:hypothetical protein